PGGAGRVGVAVATPGGPVYLTVPRERLSARADSDSFEAPRQAPSSAHPDPALMDRLADWLLAAERPLLIASSLGRRGEDVEQLGRIAGRFAVPVVVHTPRFLCLPTDHPLHHGFDPHPLLADSDLIVVFEAAW